MEKLELQTSRNYIQEIEELKRRLAEAEETLDAIRAGNVDALVVNSDGGLQVFALKSADHTYRILIEEMNESALILSEDSAILYCNSSFANLVGMSLTDVMTKRFFDFIASENLPEVEKLFRNASTEISKLETVLMKDKKRIPAKLSLKYFKEKNIHGLNMIVTDISEQKNSARAIKIYQQELEDKVDELKMSNSELEQFAYVASHDLKEPLRMISSFTSLLMKKVKMTDRDALEYRGYILEGISRMNTLINDLLQYSRVGRADVTFKKVNCNDIMESALANLHDKIAESQAEIIIHEKLPEVEAVPALLTQVFQNLIENSLKFSRKGETPHIEIDVELKDSYWEFSFEDNGIGIDPQYGERIFVIFQRLHTKDKYPGSGIGLSITKKIIEFHGGRIWLDPLVEKGCGFRFTLPAKE